MAERSFRKTLRTRVAPVIFIGALVLLGMRTCGKEMASVDLSFNFGRAAANVRAFRVDVHRGDEVAPVAFHSANFGESGAIDQRAWSLQLDSGSYVLKIMVTTTTGVQRISRKVDIEDRSRMTINLEPDLVPDN